jgi:NifU-like protein
MNDTFQWLYSPVVKDHFTNPRNVFDPDESFVADAEGVVGNIKCGDQMMFMLKIADDVITEVRWKTYGCASAIASTSMLSEVIKGMAIRDAYTIKPSDIASRLKGEDAVVICNCLGITDKDIEQAARDGARSWEQLQAATKIGTVCGSCKPRAEELLHEFAHIYGEG